MKAGLFKLDSEALLFPSTITKKRTAVNRISVIIKEKVDPEILKQAVADIAPRFPVMYTRIYKGFMWDYLKRTSFCDVVKPDVGYPCRPFDYKNKEKPLFHILYTDNEISLEFCHITGDGGSGTVYINTLLTRYFELKGHTIEKNENILDINEEPDEEEFKDHCQKVYELENKRKFMQKNEKASYHYDHERLDDYLQVMYINIPIDAIKKHLKDKYGGCTITEYLTSVYGYAYLSEYKKDKKNKKPVNMQVSVNMRKYWETKSVRNFSGITDINVKPDKKDYDFGDVLNAVRKEFSEKISKERMADFICKIVSSQQMFILRILPRFIKKYIFKIIFFLFGERLHVASLANIGYNEIPPSLAEHVAQHLIYIGETPINRLNCTISGINNVLTIAFTAVNKNKTIQNFCIDFLKADGLDIDVFIRNE
ncbi:MAG: hypothetical protein FWF08_06170 [Oscillospiraceae bacterium]|nr:hypothetical protein [Oscillospiraceae bacterium]